MIEKHYNELKKHFHDYISEKKIEKSLLSDEYLKLYLNIIELFSKSPWVTQEEVFNLFKLSDKKKIDDFE